MVGISQLRNSIFIALTQQLSTARKIQGILLVFHPPTVHRLHHLNCHNSPYSPLACFLVHEYYTLLRVQENLHFTYTNSIRCGGVGVGVEVCACMREERERERE